MALVNCKECRREISEHAAHCVHCGDPRRTGLWVRRALTIVLAILALYIVVMFALSGAMAWGTRKPITIDLPQNSSSHVPAQAVCAPHAACASRQHA